MSDVRGLPDLPRSLSLGEAEQSVEAFGYELCIRPMEEPKRKQPIGFAHED